MAKGKLLTIAIPTVIGREEKFNRLLSFVMNQVLDNHLQSEVEVIYARDNKEISIGAKRDTLYKISRGQYTVMIDDDDWVDEDFVIDIHKACLDGNDCIGYKEGVTIDGNNKGDSLISIGYPDWIENMQVKGCVRVRTPFFKCPIKTSICREVGVGDMRWGEDHDFARRILPYLHTQTFIDKVMYKYGFVSEGGTYWDRFGIKK